LSLCCRRRRLVYATLVVSSLSQPISLRFPWGVTTGGLPPLRVLTCACATPSCILSRVHAPHAREETGSRTIPLVVLSSLLGLTYLKLAILGLWSTAQRLWFPGGEFPVVAENQSRLTR